MNAIFLKPNLRKRPLKFLFVTSTLVAALLISAIYVSKDQVQFSASRGTAFLDALKSALFPFKLHAKTPLILVWTTYFSEEHWIPKLEDLQCPASCFISYNRSILNSSDAVLFHLRDVKLSDLPAWRTEKQVWVLLNKEAPPHTPADQVAALRSNINWTVTYRRDSDIYSPYGIIRERSSANVPTKTKGVPNKYEAFVCWIVSHCVTHSRRENYVKELKRFIPVSVYGTCGERACPTKDPYSCYVELSKSCKFYLSFENSICKDYATEKLFYALRSGMVPVVMGGEDYSKSLPENSYIDVSHYKDAKDLAALLWQLHKNNKKYKAYQEWRNYYEVQDTSFSWVCELCEKLYRMESEGGNSRTNFELDDWWFGNASCKSWQEYFDSTS